jgi:hypothetical protein
LQETSRSAGLGAHAFVTLRPIGGVAPIPVAPATPPAGQPTVPFWSSPEFERLMAELARALAPTNGTSSDTTRTPVGRI